MSGLSMVRASAVATAGLVALLVAGAAHAQALVRAPYLQSVTPTSIVIAWRTSSPTEGVVRFGASPDALDRQQASPGPGTDHFVTLTGLEPDTRYFYAVGTRSARLAGADVSHFFRTSPAPGTRKPMRLWIVGDSGTGTAPQFAVRDAMLAHTRSRRPDLYLHLGDIAYEFGTDAEFTERFFAPYASILRNTPVFPTLGNHEGVNADSATETGPYYDAYALPRRGEAGGVPSGTEAYYSFDYGNAHFIVLDSHDSPRGPQGAMLTWLREDLAATRQEWIIAYWHHPPYSKGTHDSDLARHETELRTHALPILEAGGVDLVLAGHSHIYERSFLVAGAYATPTTAAGHILDSGSGRLEDGRAYGKREAKGARDGAVYVVAGHGGRRVGRKGTHPLMYFTEVAYGSGLLDIDGPRLDFRNLRADGVVSDWFTLAKGSFLRLDEPSGAEVYLPGVTATARWTTFGEVPEVKVELSVDDGKSWTTLAERIANSGRLEWTPPPSAAGGGRLRVLAAGAPAPVAAGEARFQVSPAGGFRLVQPGGGELLRTGEPFPIRWSSTGAPGRARLEYTLDDGARWITLGVVEDSGEHPWRVPVASTARARVRILGEDRAAAAGDQGDAFSILGEPMTLIAAGEPWRYDERGAPPATGWSEPSYDDRGWKTGQPLAGEGARRVLLRRRFRVDGPVAAAELVVLADRPLELFLNGRPVGAIRPVEGAPPRHLALPLDREALVVGENVLAVDAAAQERAAPLVELQLFAQLATGEWRSSGPAGCGCRGQRTGAPLLLLGLALFLARRPGARPAGAPGRLTAPPST